MIWLTFCVLASNAPGGDFLEPSISDAIRIGATIASRFLNPQPPELFNSVFHKLTKGSRMSEEATRRGGGREGNDLILFILKLMGVDSRKITDFAFDGMISLVHLALSLLFNSCAQEESEGFKEIHVSYTKREIRQEMNVILLKDEGKRRKQREAPKGFSLFQFILNQPQVIRHLEQMQDPNLTDLILNETQNQLKSYPEGDVGCIKLLICRMKPFVLKMQRSLRFFMEREEKQTSGEGTCRKDDEGAAWDKANLEGRMYFFVPGLEEVIEWGDRCNQLFRDCIY